jgi:hypothetical protein
MSIKKQGRIMMKPWQAPLHKPPSSKWWNEEQRERESTQASVKRAKPKGCKGINYVFHQSQEASEKERKGNF